MKNLIIFEYFSCKSNLDNIQNRKIFKEGLNIASAIAKSLSDHKERKIIVLLNSGLLTKSLKNVSYLETNLKQNWIWHLKKFDPANTEIILVAPEQLKINEKIFKILSRMRFKILGSSFKIIKTFSSKLHTYKTLQKQKLPCVETNHDPYNLKNCGQLVVMKPEHGAGSQNIKIIQKKQLLKISFPDKSYVFQPLIYGLAGSINLLCFNGKGIVIGLNKHIVKNNGKSVKQIGSIIGGLESYREELEIMSKNICRNFPELFGFIGIDIIKDNGTWKIIEINSRFTSTLCGLQKSYGKLIPSLIGKFYLSTPQILKKRLDFIKETKIFF